MLRRAGSSNMRAGLMLLPREGLSVPLSGGCPLNHITDSRVSLPEDDG